MPRNGSGNYALPTGINPVISGTSIATSWANTTLNDVAAALTQSVSNDGQTVLTGNLNAGGQRVTSLGTGIAATDAVNLTQQTSAISAAVAAALSTFAITLDQNSPIFTSSTLITTTAGILGTTQFGVTGDQTALFTNTRKCTFQNTRFNGQIYSVSSSGFGGGITTVAFSPALVAADAFIAGTTIYYVAGGPQSQISVNEIEFLNQAITTSVTATGNKAAVSITSINNAGGWSIAQVATKLNFSYNGVLVASLATTGLFTSANNIVAFGTP